MPIPKFYSRRPLPPMPHEAPIFPLEPTIWSYLRRFLGIAQVGDQMLVRFEGKWCLASLRAIEYE